MAHYRIKAVSRMLGVRPELLRMWEKRYHLFKPQRADNRYREFDDEDVQLLRYICQQIDQGRAIGELAAEGREALLLDSYIQFFPQLSNQRRFRRLARFDFAAGEFPQTSHGAPDANGADTSPCWQRSHSHFWPAGPN